MNTKIRLPEDEWPRVTPHLEDFEATSQLQFNKGIFVGTGPKESLVTDAFKQSSRAKGRGLQSTFSKKKLRCSFETGSGENNQKPDSNIDR